MFLRVHASGQTFGFKVFAGDERLNTDSSYTLLRYHCIPELKQINGGSLDNMHWQQDGASCHRAGRNIHYLEGQFGDRLFAKGSRIGKNWPARSPDLNVMDFCIWGWLKPRISVPPMPTTIPELIDKLNVEIAQIPPQLIRNACASVYDRCQRILDADGGFIE